jgi:bifunctional oligoribonuclease and PAP phosphatase NrnA
MFDESLTLITDAQKIVVVQAENPDGDSLGSALALEELLSDLGKEVILYCAIDIPKYMHYISGWDRVTKDWPFDADAAIIVDTTSPLLLVKTFESPSVSSFLDTHPVLVIDHHQEGGDRFTFSHVTLIDDSAVATSQIIYRLAQHAEWAVNPTAAEQLFIALQSDSLGLTTPNTSADSYQVAADLVQLGAVPSTIETRRREYMKKPADILEYKGRLIGRIEYHLDGLLATVHIPWDEIEEYSDRYNPSVLVLDEMRLVEGVQVAIAIKTYPDGKLTGKIRTNQPIGHIIAGFFGGGGHEYSAGFKVFESYDTIMSELIKATDKATTDYETAIS